MKKFFKFVFGATALAAAAAGALYCYKKFFACNKDNDDDFEDDLDDLEFDDEENDDSREYVSINITADEAEEAQPVTE